MIVRNTALAAVLGTLGTTQAIAQVPPAEIRPHADTAVATRSQVTIGQRTIPYTATAGLFPLYVNDTGELMGSIFFIAYVADRASGQAPRPITFLWNGGPGANSSQVHIVGYGPKRIRTPDTYPEWGPNTESAIVNHPETWLESSDLVFVDPPGTGYSRATSTAFRDILYNGRGDAEAVAELIRVYLNRYTRWDSPVFIAGESYGTTRAMLVSEALEKRRTRLAGVILISGGYNAGQTVPGALNQALGISELTATAHFHRILPADLQALPQVEAVKRAVEWARREYAPALTRRDSLSAAERSAIVEGLARYTGINPRYVDQRTLSVPNYGDNLMRDRGLELGRYDSRMVLKQRGEGVVWGPTNDPSLSPMIDLMQGTSRLFNSYVRDTLKFRTTLLYRGPFGGAFHPESLAAMPGGVISSDWMAAMFKMAGSGAGGGGAQASARADTARPLAQPPLRRAMEMNPNLLVMSLVGMYDGSCAAREEAVAQTPAHLRSRVRAHCYAGGHMYYSDREARRESQRDFAEFVRDAIARRSAAGKERRAPEPSPYRILVAAESEDQVALVEFRPCGPTGAAPACGAIVARTYAVGVNPVEIEGPHGVVASSDGRSFYVSMAHGRPTGSLLRYELASGSLTGQVELGMFPATIDLSAAGDLAYVVNFNFHDPAMLPSSLSVVDVATLEEVARATTCRMPHGSRLAPDGAHHYSACMMDDLLVDVDVRTTRVSRMLRLTSGREGAVLVGDTLRARHEGHDASANPTTPNACSPTWAQPSGDGATVWITCTRSNEIVVVDVAAWRVVKRVSTPATPYNAAVTADGALMVVTHKGPGSTTLWRTSDASLVAEIRGSRRIASGVAVSADSRFAFVTFEGRNDDPGTLDIIDLAARKTVASVNVGKQAGGVAVVR